MAFNFILNSMIDLVNSNLIDYVTETYENREDQISDFNEKIKDVRALKRCKEISSRYSSLLPHKEEQISFLEKFLDPKHEKNLVKLIWESNQNHTSQKIQTIKEVRRFFDIGLKEAKDLVEKVCGC